MINKIEETSQRSFKTMLPGVIETLKKVHSTSYCSSRRSCASHKRECVKRSETGTQVHGKRTRLHSISQTELLEEYNCRDNVKVFAVPFESNTEGVLMKENGKDTIGKVMTYPAS